MKTQELTIVIGFAILCAVALVFFAKRSRPGPDMAGTFISKPAPEIKAAGWVNGSAPTSAELSGKLVVVEAWATWCLPCRLHAPELVKTYHRFNRDDVIFIGLTTEGEDDLPAIKKFLNDLGIAWRNGYGADQTLIDLNAEYIPTTYLIDRDGMICWQSDSSRQSLEDILREKLNESATAAKNE